MKGMSLKSKLAMSTSGFLGVLKRPKYIVLALVLAFLFALLVYFIINFGVYGSFLTSSLPITGKAQAVGMMVQAMSREMVTTTNGVLLFAVSLLQGMSLALLIFTVKRNKKMDVKAVGGGGFAAIAAALGLGCVPCGTSIILPIVSIFFSSSAYAAANTASMIVLILAFLVSLYAIYKLSFAASAFTESDELKSKKEKKS